MTVSSSKLLCATALALAAVTGAAHAETYEGVHPPTSAESRADVAAGAVVAAARAPDPYAEGASSGAAPIVAGAVDRATVRAEAYAAARGNALPL